jgi:hypothetical protein
MLHTDRSRNPAADVALLQLAEPIDPLELAFSIAARVPAVESYEDPRVAGRIHARASGDDVAGRDADPAGVPLAGWLLDTRGQLPGGTRWTCRGRQHVVERRSLPMRADLRVRMPLVIDLLVLMPDGAVLVLEQKYSGHCCRRRDLPLPGQ